MSPLLKLSSSSAVALKSYLAMASILSAAQCSAAWSRGKGVFPAEATQHSGRSLASLLGLAPALRDTQCHPESEDGWLREVAGIEGSPALPIGLLSQPPRPLVRLAQPSSLPSKQEPRSPSSFQPQAQATDRPAGQWWQQLELFQNTLPLPSRWVYTVSRNQTGCSPVRSPPFLPHSLHSSPGTKRSHWEKACPWGCTLLSSVK